MNNYEKNIDAFIELIIDNKNLGIKIDKTYYYKKPKYCITLDTDVENMINLGSSFGIFSSGTVGVYITFIPYRNEIILNRDDCDSIVIESDKLMSKYEPIIEALYHKIQNDNVLNFINTSVKYLKLEAEHRTSKIKSIENVK